MLRKTTSSTVSGASNNSALNRWAAVGSHATPMRQQQAGSPEQVFIPTLTSRRISAELRSQRPTPSVPRILDHVSDNALLGVGFSDSTGAIAIYDTHITGINSSVALFSGIAQFRFDNNSTTFLIQVMSADKTVEIALSGTEHRGLLTLSGDAIPRVECGIPLYRIPMVNSTDRNNGEFEIILLSFSRVSEASSVQQSKSSIVFRNRRWTIEPEIQESTYLTGNGAAAPMLHRPAFVVCGRVYR